jgi:hypothetical protein
MSHDLHATMSTSDTSEYIFFRMTEDGTESDGDMKPDPQSHADRFQEPPPPLTASGAGCGTILILLMLIIGPLMFYLPFHIGWFEHAMEYQGSPRHAVRGFITGIVIVLVGAFLSISGIVLLYVFIIGLVDDFRSKDKDDNDDGRESKEEQ